MTKQEFVTSKLMWGVASGGGGGGLYQNNDGTSQKHTSSATYVGQNLSVICLFF